MDGPWSTDRNSLPSSEQLFDDNFSPPKQIQDTPKNIASFDPLPDSATYLANLGNFIFILLNY